MAVEHRCDRCGRKNEKTNLVAVDVIEKPDWSGAECVGGTVSKGWMFCRACWRGLRIVLDAKVTLGRRKR